MAATPYTIVLASEDNATGPFPMVLPPPVQGTVWVIRDVTFYFPSSGGWLPAVPQATIAIDGIVVAATPAFRTVADTLYETRDIRQTFEGVSQLSFNTGASTFGWQFRVTGYAFS